MLFIHLFSKKLAPELVNPKLALNNLIVLKLVTLPEKNTFQANPFLLIAISFQ